MVWKFGDNIPIYLQIADIIKLAVFSGEFATGSKLPGVRELAAESKVNPNTVQRGLSALEESGLIHTAGTAGRFVTQNEEIIINARREFLKTKADSFIKEMNAAGFNKAEIKDCLKQFS